MHSHLNFPDSTKSKAFLYCLLDLLYSDTICLACGEKYYNDMNSGRKVTNIPNEMHLVRLGASEGHRGRGKTGVDWPAVSVTEVC